MVGFDLEAGKIEHLLGHDNFTLHRKSIDEAVADGSMQEAVAWADVVVNLAAICNPYEYAIRPSAVIKSSLFDALPIVDLCCELNTWLIQFSTCEVYGRTVSSYVPEEGYSDPDLYVQSESRTPLVMGPVSKQRWCYASAKQTLERYVYALGFERQMPFTIIRPYNFFGPRMDFIPGRDGTGIPRVLACFITALLDDEPLLLVDGGTARRTITSIHDAIDAMMAMFDRPHAATGQIFNIGADGNELTISELAHRMREIYADVSCDPRKRNLPILNVTGEEFYGKGGYEDCDRRVIDSTNATSLLGWSAKIGIDEILRETISYYYEIYADKTAVATR